MAVTVGVVVKKAAAMLLSSKKGRKVMLAVVLGVILCVVFPLVLVILTVTGGGVELDRELLASQVIAGMTAEELAQLALFEETMTAIESAMTEAGYGERVVQAQMLTLAMLQEVAGGEDFVSRLVGCFALEQSDEQLVEAVNAAFGTAITVEEFRELPAYAPAETSEEDHDRTTE